MTSSRVKNNRTFAARIAAGLLVLALILSVTHVTVAYAETGNEITCKEDLNHEWIKIGVGEGGTSEQIVEKELPKAQRMYMSHTDGYQSVAQGKVDAFIFEREGLQLAIDSGRTGVRLLDENMDEAVHVAVGLSPVSSIDDIEGKINTFIRELKADGTLDDMYDRWVNKRDETFPDITLPEDPQIHLTVGTTGVVPPFSYYKDSKLTGYDIELAYRFAAWLGADVDFKVYDYAGIVPAAVSGDVDCIMAELNVTPERAEALTFSEDLFELPVGIMVRDTAAVSDHQPLGFVGSVKESFEKNFIREDRWILFVNGVLLTLLITVLSIVCGTVLGFCLLLLCKDGNPVANAVTRFSIRLIQGMPMVVLLMILYYIVFGNMNISGVIVSIIAFTLTFGSAVYGLLKMGVDTIDIGQYEAAYALGFSVNRTFFNFILPQVLPIIIDSYRSEIVSLIKATAIVGYIAVQDLTKVGDIVRSRTYEAFFPLIAIAIIYFVLEGVFVFLVSRIKIKLDPRKRNRI